MAKRLAGNHASGTFLVWQLRDKSPCQFFSVFDSISTNAAPSKYTTSCECPRANSLEHKQ